MFLSFFTYINIYISIKTDPTLKWKWCLVNKIFIMSCPKNCHFHYIQCSQGQHANLFVSVLHIMGLNWIYFPISFSLCLNTQATVVLSTSLNELIEKKLKNKSFLDQRVLIYLSHPPCCCHGNKYNAIQLECNFFASFQYISFNGHF